MGDSFGRVVRAGLAGGMLVDLTSQDKSTGQVRKIAMGVATGIESERMESEPQSLLGGGGI